MTIVRPSLVAGRRPRCGRAWAVSWTLLVAAVLIGCGGAVPRAASTPNDEPAIPARPPTATVPTTTALATSAPTPTRTSSPDAESLSADVLVETLRPHLAAEHLAALQAIGDRHGGRSNGTPGHAESLAYVAAQLDGLGLHVALQPFSRDGVAGTNVIAERPGRGDELVVIGAHLDTVAGSPGINDNGSGVAALLVIAEALARLPPPQRTIHLAFWDAEEGGPYGSRAHVEALGRSELSRIAAYLNLDMVGSPNPLRLVYAEADAVAGSGRITDLFGSHFDAAGLAWETIDLGGDSDHGPFAAAGIPTGGLFSGGIEPVTASQAARFGATPGVPADPCSHAPCDRVENVNLDVLAELTRAAAAALAGLASSAAER